MRDGLKNLVYVLVAVTLLPLGPGGCGPTAAPEGARLADGGPDVLADRDEDAASGGLMTPDQVYQSMLRAQAAGTLGAKAVDRERFPTSSPEELAPNRERLVYDLDGLNLQGDPNLGADQSVSLTSHDSPIKDQGQRGTCTAFATVAAMENKAHQSLGKTFDLSEEHLWSFYRQGNGDMAVRSGSRNFITSEADWPYNRRGSGTNGLLKIATLQNAPNTVSDMIRAVRAGNPIVFLAYTNEGFWDTDGFVDSRLPWKRGAHAMELVGVQFDARFAQYGGGYFVIKNSWGTSWGNRGYGFIPFDYCQRQYCWVGYQVAAVTARDSSVPVPVDGSFAVSASYESAKRPGRKAFRLAIKASASDLARIESVDYDIHETFGAARHAVVSTPTGGFATVAYETYASGWTTKGTTIRLKDGKTVSLPGTAIEWRTAVDADADSLAVAGTGAQ